MDSILEQAFVLFALPGLFEIEFVGDSVPRHVHIQNYTKNVDGNWLHLLSDDGKIYNWVNVIYAKRID